MSVHNFLSADCKIFFGGSQGNLDKKNVREILVTRPRNVFIPSFTWCDLSSSSGGQSQLSSSVCGWAANVSVAARPSV